MTRRGLSTRQAGKLVDELLMAPDEATQQQWLEGKLESCRFESESVPVKSKRQLTPRRGVALASRVVEALVDSITRTFAAAAAGESRRASSIASG